MINEDYRLKIVAKCDAPAVEVEDLRHGAVGTGVKSEPDARASQVVSVERVGNGISLAEPHRIVRRFAGYRHRLPTRLVEIDVLAMCQVAAVRLPHASWKFAKHRETLDHSP